MKIKLEIEGVFKVANRGHFVIARCIDPTQNFSITKKSFLGGVELMEYLDIPRSIDEYGNQRDVVALQLKNAEDAPLLTKGAVVELEPTTSFLYLEPWVQLLSGQNAYEEELRKEISPNHILHGKKMKVIGKRQDNDSILIELDDEHFQFATVHLTWTKSVESNASFPLAQLFTDWIDLYNNRIVVDHEDYE